MVWERSTSGYAFLTLVNTSKTYEILLSHTTKARWERFVHTSADRGLQDVFTCCCVNLMWIRCEYKLNEMQTIQLFVYNKGHTSISILKSLLKQWYIKIAQYIKIYSLFFDSTSQEREVNFQKFKNLSVNLVGIIKVSGLSKTTDHELIESAWDFCFYIYWIKIFENQHFKTKIAYFSPIWLKFYTIMHITIYYIK